MNPEVKKKKIVITGGHLTPALAVIEELIERGNWEIFFFGRKYAAEGEKTPSAEWKIISQKGIWFIPLEAGRIQPKFTAQTIPALLRLPLGFLQALWYLIKIRPDVILSFGGYLSVPVVFSGWWLRIPSVTHEQTVVLGLANKINSFFVKKIAVSWQKTIANLSSKKAVLTGNPIRKELFEIDEKFWQILNFDKERPVIFITGGNQGSHTINKTVEGVLPKLLKKYNLFHQTGHLQAKGDFERLTQVRDRLSLRLKKRYHLKKYLTGRQMGTFFSQADLIVSRGGANTATEAVVFGRPILFIPLPWSRSNEQQKNAQMLKEAGMAEILPQEKLTGLRLLKLMKKMTAHLDDYQKNAVKAKKLVKLEAAERIVDLLEKLGK